MITISFLLQINTHENKSNLTNFNRSSNVMGNDMCAIEEANAEDVSLALNMNSNPDTHHVNSFAREAFQTKIAEYFNIRFNVCG